jgi:hypothetical protein
MGNADSTKSTVDAWREAGEHRDAAAAVACLADDITLISPLTGRFRFHGRDQLRDVLTAAFEVIADIRYHTEVGAEPDTRALFYYGSCGGEQLEEAQLLRFDEAGKITELTLFGRPLPALTEVMKRLGPVLLRRQGRAGLARASSWTPAGASSRQSCTSHARDRPGLFPRDCGPHAHPLTGNAFRRWPK